MSVAMGGLKLIKQDCFEKWFSLWSTQGEDNDKDNLFNVRNTEWLPNLLSWGLMTQVFDRKKMETMNKAS